jgi:hypothetical protein
MRGKLAHLNNLSSSPIGERILAAVSLIETEDAHFGKPLPRLRSAVGHEHQRGVGRHRRPRPIEEAYAVYGQCSRPETRAGSSGNNWSKPTPNNPASAIKSLAGGRCLPLSYSPIECSEVLISAPISDNSIPTNSRKCLRRDRHSRRLFVGWAGSATAGYVTSRVFLAFDACHILPQTRQSA